MVMPEADRNYDCIGTDVQYWDRQNASFAAYVIVGRKRIPRSPRGTMTFAPRACGRYTGRWHRDFPVHGHEETRPRLRVPPSKGGLYIEDT